MPKLCSLFCSVLHATMSAWTQKANSLLDQLAIIGKYGLEPQLWGRPKPKDKEYYENVSHSQVRFKEMYGKPMPGFWPLHEDGTAVTNLYRLIDETFGTDLVHPPSSEAMSHRLVEGHTVDFNDPVAALTAEDAGTY